MGIFPVNMPIMYTRLLPTPPRSILLLGPRGTGKSTWIRSRFSDARSYDLLDMGESVRLNRNPDALFHELQALEPETWAVIDEIQKAPDLLDQAHRLMENRGLNFVLSGSSARKLRQGGVNLLAGRAITAEMYPLTSAELGEDFDLERSLRFGNLPIAATEPAPQEYLRSYAETYLDQEIRAEALTRNFAGFARFLEIAARQNGQTTNVSAISRDAAVARNTVQHHFDVLVDTLIGYWLPPWKLKPANKQVSHSKFYLFDCGVARALAGRLAYPVGDEERGALLETLILGEMRACLAYSGLRYPLHFWRDHHGAEVDILLETATGHVAIEIKASTRWERRFNRGLRKVGVHLGSEKTRYYGIYLGNREARFDEVRILPAKSFLNLMWQDGFFDS